jgi:Zn-dependent protease with chaperone function
MAKAGVRLDHQRLLRSALWRTLLFPVLILIFFLGAPSWYSSKVHSSLDKEILASNSVPESKKAEEIAFFDKLDLQEVCFHPPARLARLSEGFEKDGISSTFQRLWWGQIFSVILVGLLGVSMLSIMSLNLDAKKSVGELVRNYRWGWWIAMTTSLIKLVLLIPLMTYGSFEFTVLLANQFFPKVLLLVILGGLIALWASVKVLLKKVPLEFVEPLSREITPEDAPEMWGDIRQAAATVEATAPDHVIVGMQMNFFVTELAVKTDTSLVTGRTLFLSFPLLKQLSRSEVLAIVGHELGHFKGNDTRMTREFYPLRRKVNETLMGLSRAGWVGWPSTGLLMFFSLTFEATIQQLSRKREFLADQLGAALTTPDTFARALVKFSVMAEAFQRMLKDSSAMEAASPISIRWHSFIGDKILPEDPFWTQLGEKQVPHPLDSHPALVDRLKALGDEVHVADAREIALQESETAFDLWFANRELLFAELSQKVESVVKSHLNKAKLDQADYQTPEGKQLLEEHFPELRWQRKKGGLVMGVVVFGAMALGLLALAIFVPLIWVRLGFGLGGLLLGWVAWGIWKCRNEELILTVNGVTNPRWKRTLHFSEVENLFLQRNQTTIIARFVLKEKQPTLLKYSLVRMTKAMPLPISTNWNDKPLVIAQTIYRYYVRQPVAEG